MASAAYAVTHEQYSKEPIIDRVYAQARRQQCPAEAASCFVRARGTVLD